MQQNPKFVQYCKILQMLQASKRHCLTHFSTMPIDSEASIWSKSRVSAKLQDIAHVARLQDATRMSQIERRVPPSDSATSICTETPRNQRKRKSSKIATLQAQPTCNACNADRAATLHSNGAQRGACNVACNMKSAELHVSVPYSNEVT